MRTTARRRFLLFPVLVWSVLFTGGLLQAGVVYQLDFSGARGDVGKWFASKGWRMEQDIRDMNPRFENGALVIEPKGADLGFIARRFKPGEYLRGAKRLQIVWGVEQYPADADWAGPRDKKRNTREPICVMVFFGEKKYDSGSFFVKDLPRFIAFFLGEKETPGKIYYGNYWQKGGRYYCASVKNKPFGTVQTDVPLDELYRKCFGGAPEPVSALAIEVDVQNTKKANGRHSKAFLKSIRLLSD